MFRDCGECIACCTGTKWASGNAYGHKFGEGQSCRFLCKSGCGIHKVKPKHCSEISCAWVYGMISEEMRPDKSGIIPYYVKSENSSQVDYLLIMPVYGVEKIEENVINYFKEWSVKMNIPVAYLNKDSENPYFLVEDNNLQIIFDGVNYVS